MTVLQFIPCLYNMPVERAAPILLWPLLDECQAVVVLAYHFFNSRLPLNHEVPGNRIRSKIVNYN